MTVGELGRAGRECPGRVNAQTQPVGLMNSQMSFICRLHRARIQWTVCLRATNTAGPQQVQQSHMCTLLLDTGHATGTVLHTWGGLCFVLFTAVTLVPGRVPGSKRGLQLGLLNEICMKCIHPTKRVTHIYPPSTLFPQNCCQVQERGDTRMDQAQHCEKCYKGHITEKGMSMSAGGRPRQGDVEAVS